MASIITRETDSQAGDRSGITNNNAPLLNSQIDANFIELNNDKLEGSDAVTTNTPDTVVKRDGSGGFSMEDLNAGVITAYDVVLGSGSASSLFLQDNTATNGYQLRADVSSSSNDGLLIEDLSGNNLYQARSGSSGFHAYYIDNTERMRIDSSGNVGIGTSSPSERLHVAGVVQVDGGSGYGHIEIGGTSGAYIDLKAPASDDYDARIITTGSGLNIATNAGTGGISLQHEGATKLATTSTGISVTGSVILGNWSVTQSGTDLVFATGGTNKMKLDASGNLTVVGEVTAFGTV